MSEKDDMEVTSVSLVEAPKCMECSTKMKGHSALKWKCVNPTCPERGRSVEVVGVYPFFTLGNDIKLKRVQVPETVKVEFTSGNERSYIEDDGCYVTVGHTMEDKREVDGKIVTVACSHDASAIPSEVFWQLVDDLLKKQIYKGERGDIEVVSDPTLPPDEAEMRSSTGQVVRLVNIGTKEEKDED